MDTASSSWLWIIVVAVGVVTACSNQHSGPSWIADLGYESTEVLPLETGQYGFPYVNVSINGSDHLLALDTGNMIGLLLSPHVATALELPTSDTSRHFDSAGNLVATATVFQIQTLAAFGSKWHGQKAHEHELAGVAGLIGPKYLLGGRFTLDYVGGLMAVSRTRAPDHPNAVKLPLVHSPRHDALILVGGWVNDERTTIEIDTGKSRTVVDPALIQKQSLPEASNGFRVDDIRLGSFHFSAPAAKEKSFAGISRGLNVPIGLGIGSDLLSTIVLTVDYPAGMVLLLPQ